MHRQRLSESSPTSKAVASLQPAHAHSALLQQPELLATTRRMMLRYCQAPARCSGTRRSTAASTHLRRARQSKAPEVRRPFLAPNSHSSIPSLQATRCRSDGMLVRDDSQPERTSTAEPSSTPLAPTAAPPEADAGPRITREWTSLGSKVIESNQAFDGPENQKDFWEGDNFEGFGKLVERYFLPTLVVLGLICGGIAARSYNEGAEGYIKPPGSPDDEAAIIVAVPQGTPDSSSMVVAPDKSL